MIVGTAEIEVLANGSAFESELKAQTSPALTTLGKDAEVAGTEAGEGLSSGVSKGTKGIEEDLAKTGKKGGSSLAKGAKDVLGTIGVPAALMSGWGALGLAVVGTGVATFMMGEKMQTATTAISNHEHISVKAANAIGDAMLGTAMHSEYSGQEMAMAFSNVAGQLKTTEGHALSTKESLDVMTESSDLASASGTDLATTTTTVAASMQAFQTPVKDVGKVTDILFNTANATGQSISTVGGAFDKLRARLGSAAPPMKDMATLVADMTKHGETGRAAMMALGTAFNGIVSPTQKVSDAQKFLGVNLLNAKGQVLPMRDMIAQLSPKLRGMGDDQAIATLKAIGFGSASGKLLNTIRDGTSAWDKSAHGINKVGTAHAAAEKNATTLHGATETLKSGLSDLGTKIGGVVVPFVTKLELGFSKVVTEVVKHWPEISKVFKVWFDTIKPVFEGAVKAVKGFIEVVQGMVQFVTNIFGGHWSKAWAGLKKAVSGVWHEILGILETAFGGILHLVGHSLDKVVHFFWSLPGRALKALGDFVGTVFSAMLSADKWVLRHVIVPVVNLWKSLPGRAFDALGDIVSFVFSGLLSAGDWVGKHVIDPIVNTFTGLPGKIKNVIGDFGHIGKGIMNDLIGGINWVIRGIDSHIPSILGHKIFPSIPEIPTFADGAIVTKPTLGIFGEAGPEAIIPLGQGQHSLPGATGPSNVDHSRNLTIENLTINAQDDGHGRQISQSLGSKLSLVMAVA